MIFVTVGSQMPFRRLVRAMDEWACSNPTVDVIAQLGIDPMYRPAALIAYDSLVPEHYARLLGDCDLVVAHAGMGTVLTALEHGKPMILMPRRAELKETRNDHQVATLQWLQGKAGIYPAADADELKTMLDGWRETGLAAPGTIDHRPASFRGLVDTLRDFIG